MSKPTMFTTVEEGQRPAAYRLDVTSNEAGWQLHLDKALFYKEKAAREYALKLINGARARQVNYFKVGIVNLYKDEYSGRLLPGGNIPVSYQEIKR